MEGVTCAHMASLRAGLRKQSKLKYLRISSTQISNQANSCWHPQYMGQVRQTSAITPGEKEL